MPNFWRTRASHPPLLRDAWQSLEAATPSGLGVFNWTNALDDAHQVEIDEVIRAAARGA